MIGTRAEHRSPLLSLLLVLALAASMLAATAVGASASHDFDDVPDDHAFHDEISWMVDEGITVGFEDNTFRPMNNLTRQAMVQFLYVMAGSPEGDWTNDFSDVSTTHQFHDAISWASENEVVLGFDDGTFRPSSGVRRQAAASFIFKAACQPEGEWTSDFNDVDEFHRFYGAISWMVEQGITEGWDDNTFRPTNILTRQGAAAFLSRVNDAGIEIPPLCEPDPDPGPAVDLELTPETSVNPVGSEHTVTATLTDENDLPASDSNVRFEVYPAAGGDRIFGQVRTVEDGVATFTYGSTVERDDVILACVGTAACTSPANTLVYDDLSEDYTNIREGVNDTATKTWQERVATTIELDPEHEDNIVGTDHTVTATVTDQFEDALGGEDVTFQVFRETDVAEAQYEEIAVTDSEQTTAGTPANDEDPAEGTATFTYTGPEAPAEDIIVACIGDACASLDDGDNGDGSIVFEEDAEYATATKSWVAQVLELTLDPVESTNAYDVDHVITATVTDQAGTPVQDVELYYEVYRGTATTTIDEDDVTTNADGEAIITIDAPGVAAEDTIYVCYNAEDTSTAPDCTQVAFGSIVENPDAEVETATKTWVEPEYSIELFQEDDLNLVGDDHTVTAVITDQFGVERDALPAGEDLTWEIARYVTDEDGVTTGPEIEDPGQDDQLVMTYSVDELADGQVRADDTIYACLADDCIALAGGQVVVNPALSADEVDSVEKAWVEVVDAEAGAYEGIVTEIDEDGVTVFVGDGWLWFSFDDPENVFADNEFIVDGEEADDAADFAEQVEVGATITVQYDPVDGSTFVAVNPEDDNDNG